MYTLASMYVIQLQSNLIAIISPLNWISGAFESRTSARVYKFMITFSFFSLSSLVLKFKILNC
jgi:hypothetical protein